MSLYLGVSDTPPNKNKISFSVTGQPVGKGRPKAAKRGQFVTMYTPEKTRNAEQSFLAQALPHKPESPLTGALAVKITFWFAVPESWSKKKQKAAIDGLIFMTSKPDLDNAVKLVLDSLNEVFFLDDKQIYSLQVRKEYSRFPRTSVEIEEF